MRKQDEMKDPGSCLNKAKPNEMLFVLLGRDLAAPATIRYWIQERIALGLNTNDNDDGQLIEAEACAAEMEDDQDRKLEVNDGERPRWIYD